MHVERSIHNEMQQSWLESGKKSARVNISNQNTISSIQVFFICSLHEKLYQCCCYSQGSWFHSEWTAAARNGGWAEIMCERKLNVMKHASGNVIHFVFILLKKGGKNALNVLCGSYKNVWVAMFYKSMLYVTYAVQMRVNESNNFQLTSIFIFSLFKSFAFYLNVS